MAWLNSNLDPTKRESYVVGNKPYGAYWTEVPDDSLPDAPVIPVKETLDDVVSALKAQNIPIPIKSK